LLATRNLQNQLEVVTPVVENQSDIENNSNVSGHPDNGEPLSDHHPVIHTEFELPREDVSGGVTVHHDGDNDVGDQNTIDENRMLNGTQICSTSRNPEITSSISSDLGNQLINDDNNNDFERTSSNNEALGDINERTGTSGPGFVPASNEILANGQFSIADVSMHLITNPEPSLPHIMTLEMRRDGVDLIKMCKSIRECKSL